MVLADWKTKLDEFLRFNERGVLADAGKMSREAADKKAEQEYEFFSAKRRVEMESQAEQEAIREIEQTAKLLPQTTKKRKKKREDGEP